MTLQYCRKFGVLVMGLLIATAALANEVPTPYKADARNAWVRYQAHNVVSIHLPFNDALTVYLGDDEVIDPSSFSVSASSELQMPTPGVGAHTISFSVIDATVPSEITFNTNLHTYVLRVQADIHAPPLYTLTFLYPHKKPHTRYANFIHQPTGKKLNQLYWYAGDRDLKPTAVWDDGFFTYFIFARRTKLPSIYSVYDALGDEQIENTAMVHNGQWVEVRGLAREYTLRLGNEWLQILNQGYKDA